MSSALRVIYASTVQPTRAGIYRPSSSTRRSTTGHSADWRVFSYMEPEPTSAPTSTTPPTLAELPATDPSPTASFSPWEDYLTGKKVPADRFLDKMGQGV